VVGSLVLRPGCSEHKTFTLPVHARPQHCIPSQRYNILVPAPEPQTDSHKHHRHAVYASETTGLLLIAFLLLVLTLVRYWHDIHWSLR
jgi:hypothetical protein